MLQTSEGDYCVLQTSITNGLHSVTHPSPDASFLVLVFGFAHDVSYGYVAGYNVGPADTVKPIPSTMSTGAQGISIYNTQSSAFGWVYRKV